MADKAYFLTEQDRQVWRRLVEMEANYVRRPSQTRPDSLPQTGSTFVAVPPCGQGIPPREDDMPGARDCCIFALVQETKDGPYLLRPVLNPDGTQVRRTVLNIHDVGFAPRAGGTEFYIKIFHEKYGTWLCERPTGDESSTFTTTTTTPDPNQPNQCQGTCKQVWSAADQVWNVASKTCHLGTTTTSSTTTSSTTSTTSTTSDCLCPTTTTTTADPNTTTTSSTTTSSTTSTTTTTSGPCQNCDYPLFCGSADGECTYTSCTNNSSTPQVDCTSTTTSSTTSTTSTTCDCNTTTTTPAPGEGGPTGCTTCTWKRLPYYGLINLDNGCNEVDCFCPSPGSLAECATATLNCERIPPPPPPPPPPSCVGKCYYICTGFPNYWWAWIGDTCSRFYNCFCEPPGTGCDECGARATTSCKEVPPPTSTTPNPNTGGPCAHCYTTTTSSTTSTTTTTGACGTDCKYAADGDMWSLEDYGCLPGCTCTEPAFPPQDTCHVTITPCYQTTTTTTTTTSSTTTSSTTSTTTTTKRYKCVCHDTTAVCVEDAAGPFYSLVSCQEYCLNDSCQPTTSTTTTTSTTPPGPCPDPCEWTYYSETKSWVCECPP